MRQSAVRVVRLNAAAVVEADRAAALLQQLEQAQEGTSVEQEFLETQFEFADFQDPLLCFVRAQVSRGRAAAAAAQQARVDAAGGGEEQAEQPAGGGPPDTAPEGAAGSPVVHVPAGAVLSLPAAIGGACSADEGVAKTRHSPSSSGGSIQHPHHRVRCAFSGTHNRNTC